MKRFIALLFILTSVSTFAQKIVNIIPENKKIETVKYELVADHQYSFHDILTNKNIHFIENDSICPSKNTIYWAKITFYNPSEYSVDYTLIPFPTIENILYTYNFDKHKWFSQKEGLLVFNTNYISGLFKLNIPSKVKQVIYFKMNVEDIKESNVKTAPNFPFFLLSELESEIQIRLIIGIVTISALFLFLLYSVLLYFNLKDRAYIYYQIILVGAILYVASNNNFFNVLFEYKRVTFNLDPKAYLVYFSINKYLNRLSTIMLLFGFVELSRLYLQTRTFQPKMDKVLKNVFHFYTLLILVVSTISICGSVYLEMKLLFLQNILILSIPLMIFYMTFRAFEYQKKLAKYFIIANILPLLVIVVFSVYYALFPIMTQASIMLISIAMLSIALTFALALVGRFNLIKDDLNQLELEANNIKSQNELIKVKLEMNQQELISSALYTAQKNELLANLKNEIEELSKNTKIEGKESINKIKSIIQSNLVLDSNFENFKIHFEQVHPNFFTDLLDKYPNLSQNELRLSAYLHLNLSNKEIATLLNINPDSVKKAKMRLKAKITN